MDEVKLAKLFHQVYEDLAPSFGYETRTDTKKFDEDSKNGKLMVATCKAILPEIKASRLNFADTQKEFEEKFCFSFMENGEKRINNIMWKSCDNANDVWQWFEQKLKNISKISE